MTLQEFISNPPVGYNGKIVRGGQCGELVRQYWIDVDKTSPPSYVNSKDYWFNPVPGYDKVQTPQPGDIAIYNGHGAYPEGHSAIYYDGRVFEQNADPDGSPAHLFNRNNTYLLGYLRKQGASMGLNYDQVNKICYMATGLQADTADAFKNNVGLELDTVLANFLAYKETRDKQLRADSFEPDQKRIKELEAQVGKPATVLKPGIYEAK